MLESWYCFDVFCIFSLIDAKLINELQCIFDRPFLYWTSAHEDSLPGIIGKAQLTCFWIYSILCTQCCILWPPVIYVCMVCIVLSSFRICCLVRWVLMAYQPFSVIQRQIYFYANNQLYLKQFSLAWVHSLIVKNISFSSYSVLSNSSNSANSV